MHIPKFFRETDEIIIEQFIRDTGFATLITKGVEYPTATHIPIELEINEKGEKVLWGHISKANPQWHEFEKSPNVLVVFLSGINSYISSSWYNHPNAPTWNYMSVQITGKIKILQGEQLWESVRRLTNRYEKKSEHPVSLDTLPEDVQKQMNGITGFEISIETIDAAYKLSQNRNEEDFQNILKELRQKNSITSNQMADAMEAQRQRTIEN